jgi:hypothetical protein
MNISIGLDIFLSMNYHWNMKLNLQVKRKDFKKQQEDLKKFWKEQFEELSRKQLELPVKLYHL